MALIGRRGSQKNTKHGGPIYHTKKLEGHPLYSEKLANYFKHIGDIVRSAFREITLVLRLDFRGQARRLVNSVRHWPKYEAQGRDDESLGYGVNRDKKIRNI